MQFLRITLSLTFFVSVFTLLGMENRGDWLGVAAHVLIGVILGLVFGGASGKWLDVIFPPNLNGTERRMDQPQP